jgi:hypothetical protein
VRLLMKCYIRHCDKEAEYGIYYTREKLQGVKLKIFVNVCAEHEESIAKENMKETK